MSQEILMLVKIVLVVLIKIYLRFQRMLIYLSCLLWKSI